jgi:murein DD-endopeptidase MepM/ murein hydrolase activator NlpD
VDTLVKAISDGVVLYYSHSAVWGTDPRDGQHNDGLVIKHYLSDQTIFYAVYGHIQTGLRKNNFVRGGNPIGKIRIYRYKDNNGTWITGKNHLHFGIQPGITFLNPNNWGVMPCPTYLPIEQMEYEDPITFIDSHSPGSIP